MKKLLLVVLIFTIATASAQINSDSVNVEKKLSKSLLGNNEIKINLLTTLFGIPEVSYERIVANNRSAGISMFFTSSTKYIDFNFGAIPYYRVYFAKRKASGFFIEANTAILNLPEKTKGASIITPSGTYYSSKIVNKTVFGIGGAIGGKFLTRAGFTGEIYLGAEKVLPDTKSVAFYPRIGYTLGKRF